MFDISCLCQNALGQRSRVSHMLQVLFNVCLVIVDTTRCDGGFPKKLKNNLSMQVARDNSLLSPLCLREESFQSSHVFTLFILLQTFWTLYNLHIITLVVPLTIFQLLWISSSELGETGEWLSLSPGGFSILHYPSSFSATKKDSRNIIS